MTKYQSVKRSHLIIRISLTVGRLYPHNPIQSLSSDWSQYSGCLFNISIYQRVILSSRWSVLNKQERDIYSTAPPYVAKTCSDIELSVRTLPVVRTPHRTICKVPRSRYVLSRLVAIANWKAKLLNLETILIALQHALPQKLTYQSFQR